VNRFFFLHYCTIGNMSSGGFAVLSTE